MQAYIITKIGSHKYNSYDKFTVHVHTVRADMYVIASIECTVAEHRRTLHSVSSNQRKSTTEKLGESHTWRIGAIGCLAL